MEDSGGSIEELLQELHSLRRQVAESRAAESERRQADEVMRTAEQRHRLLLDGISEHVVYQDLEMRVVWTNHLEVGPYSRETTAGRHCYELWHNASSPCTGCPVLTTRETGRTCEGEVATPDGSVLLIRANPVRDLEGRLVGVLEIALEITEQKQMEEALRESQERFRAVFDNSAIGISLVGPEGWVLDCNPAMCRMLGYGERELRNSHVADFTHPEDLTAQLRLLQQLVAGEREQFQLEKRYIRKGGEILWGRLTSSQARTAEGGPGFIVGMIEDITERKRSEAALRDSERRYRELADSLPETVFEMDTTGRLTFVNQAGFEKFGYGPKDLEEGISVVDHIVPEDAERAARDIAKAIGGEGVGRQEYTALKGDGTTFPVVIYSTRILRDGNPVGLRGFLVDITEQKRAEAALRESDARFRTMFERAAIGVALTDEDGRFLECNPALQLMLGYTEGELRHLRTVDVTHRDDVAAGADLYQQLMSGGRDHYRLEERHIRKDGEEVWSRVTVSLFPGGEGRPRFAISMVEDITGRKELESQLLRAQRLEGAGGEAGRVTRDSDVDTE